MECRLHGLRIPFQDGSVETVEQVASDASASAQEGVHDTHDLPVRDGQFVHPVPYGNGVEISCHDHERKQIIGIAQPQLVVAHRLMKFGSDGAAVDQVGHRLPPYGSRPVKHPSHGGVPAGIPPVAVRLEPPLDAHHDTERVIHLDIAETIPVVPVAELLELLGMAVIGEDVPDLAFGESEPLIRFRRECRVDRRIVQSGEEVRFGDLHHTGHVRHLHVVVALQRGREEAAHEGYDLLLKVRIERVRDGAIVFVDEDHGHHPVMVFQKNAKLRNRGYERGFIGFAGKDAPDHSLVLFYQILRIQEISESSVGFTKCLSHHRDEQPVVGSAEAGCEVLQVYTDHRELVFESLILLILRYRQAVEPGIALIFDVEESVQHGQVGSLAEPARTGVQIDAAGIGVEDVLDEEGLVDEVHVLVSDTRELEPTGIHLLHGFAYGLRDDKCNPGPPRKRLYLPDKRREAVS